MTQATCVDWCGDGADGDVAVESTGIVLWRRSGGSVDGGDGDATVTVTATVADGFGWGQLRGGWLPGGDATAATVLTVTLPGVVV